MYLSVPVLIFLALLIFSLGREDAENDSNYDDDDDD